ncbi:ATP-dependent DNA ligase [Leifsonia sp. SIMBA_070]|uniref:DUF7882 family protein n=1 Tax=Leifsonia sp. SIMBA_070 TaxID=3085810 RepID=UPI00397D5E73
MIEFEDRLLAHLQIVIAQKIRRGESFFMAWRDSVETGDGHSSIWIHPAQNLYFKFSGSRFPKINPAWVEALMASANSSKGLLIMTEDSISAEDGSGVTLATATPHLQDFRSRAY